MPGPPPKWSPAEREFVSTNCHRMTDRQLAARLSQLTGKTFTHQGVRRVRRDLKLKKRCGLNSRLI